MGITIFLVKKFEKKWCHSTKSHETANDKNMNITKHAKSLLTNLFQRDQVYPR